MGRPFSLRFGGDWHRIKALNNVLEQSKAQMRKPLISFISLLVLFGFTGGASADPIIIGSKKSDHYHYPKCKIGKKIPAGLFIRFTSVDQARWLGFDPCPVCKPPPGSAGKGMGGYKAIGKGDVVQKLEGLAEMRDEGVITEEEFRKAKEILL